MSQVTFEQKAKGGGEWGTHLSGGRKFQEKRVGGAKALWQEWWRGLEKQWAVWLGQSEQGRVEGDESRGNKKNCVERTLTFTLSKMELWKRPEQGRDAIWHGVTVAACRKQCGSRSGNRKTMEGACCNGSGRRQGWARSGCRQRNRWRVSSSA